MVQSNYPCTEQELYTVCRVGWQSCDENLPLFAAFRTSYDHDLIIDKLAEIQSVSEIPDFYQRSQEAKIHHIHLAKEGKDACTLYQKLKRYIVTSFPENEHAVMLDSAGQQYFTAASHNDWDAVQGMLNNASAFITANAAILQGNGGMPVNFGTIVSSARDGFTIVHDTFINAEELEKVATATKTTANNGLHTSVMSMFRDGQEITADNPELRSQFTFEHVLFLVRGAGTAGIRGTVNDGTTSLPIEGAVIQVGINNYTATSDIDGYYQISPAAAGTYSVTVSAPGYQTLTIPAHVIITGTISTLNLLLNPEV